MSKIIQACIPPEVMNFSKNIVSSKVHNFFPRVPTSDCNFETVAEFAVKNHPGLHRPEVPNFSNDIVSGRVRRDRPAKLFKRVVQTRLKMIRVPTRHGFLDGFSATIRLHCERVLLPKHGTDFSGVPFWYQDCGSSLCRD